MIIGMDPKQFLQIRESGRFAVGLGSMVLDNGGGRVRWVRIPGLTHLRGSFGLQLSEIK